SGQADQIMKPKLSEAMHRRIPGAKLVTFSGTGDAVPIEKPREVADLVSEMGGGKASGQREGRSVSNLARSSRSSTQGSRQETIIVLAEFVICGQLNSHPGLLAAPTPYLRLVHTKTGSMEHLTWFLAHEPYVLPRVLPAR